MPLHENNTVSAARQLEHDLIQRVKGEVRFDAVSRALYSTDASNYQIDPVGVVFPRDADDVATVHATASQHGVPVLPRGGGSSLAGQAVGHAIILDLSRHMAGVLSIDVEERRARVQPGVVLGHLNRQLAPLGLMIGPDPASGDRATIGGCIGNNATGMHSILYGMFSDHVRACEVVLADGEKLCFGAGAAEMEREVRLRDGVRRILLANAGEIRSRYPKTWRSVAGYPLDRLDPEALNLATLFVGSEGTLGTVVAADLALVERPAMVRMVLLQFDSLRAALELVPTILETGPSSVELIDRLLLDMTRRHAEFSRYLTFVEGDPSAVLAVEYYGQSEAELAAHVIRLGDRLAAAGFRGVSLVADTEAQMANVLRVRKAGLGLLMSMRGEYKPVPFIEDAAVPVDRLADYVERVGEIVTAHGTSMAIYAHASAGCLHIRPLLNMKTADGLERYRGIAEAVTGLVLDFEGTTSGEHGEGLSRGEFSRRLFGPQLTEAFREVKRLFDPQGIMNPGKVVDVGPMDDPRMLRYGPDYALPYRLPSTRLDWSADGGFEAAVEMCNGAGVCRKEGSGTMCPSFMATREEADSTRGRANMLRLAMAGKLGTAGLSDERVYDVLDLCLSCKACKAECPSAVDMARLKAEFTAAYYDHHGVPLRSWVFGHIHRLNRLGSIAPRVSNAAMNSALGRWVFRRLGVAPQRQLPALARERFSAWYRRHASQYGAGSDPGRRMAPILIADTYTEYNYPHLGRAALDVGRAAGFEMRVWGPGEIDCCGRPLISKGLLDDARWLANRNVRRMAPPAAWGERFMFIEPSCAAAFRDEYPDLVSGDLRDDARRVAESVITVEEWLAEAAEAGLVDQTLFDATPCQIVLHGHCYQRALWGTYGVRRMFELLPHCDVVEPDDGCCGVAGSFGFEAEHYGISMTIAEQRLFPAVREASEAIVVASGVSCREQIEHGAGRHALHPIEVMASKLKTRSS